MRTSVVEIVSDFDLITKELLGIYLDSLMGFQLTVRGVENERKKIAIEKGKTIEQINLFPFRHTSLFSERIHEETLGEFIKRMSKGGRNNVFAANMFIISIYHYWEDNYRGAIANALTVGKENIKSDIMGDIRLLRNSIVHHKAIALKEIERCKLIKFFKEGDSIELTKDQIIFIINLINNYTAKLKSEASKHSSIDETTHYEIALVLSKSNSDKELSKYHFEEAIKINRDFIEAYIDLANLLSSSFKDIKSANMYYERAIAINPKHMLARANYAAFLGMNNRIQESQQNFIMALEIDSEHVTTNYNYALILKRNLKEFEKAKYHFERALEIEPLNHEILLQYANLLREDFRDFIQAELYYNQIIELNMTYAAGHNDYGLFLMENKGDVLSAESEFKKAIELNENYSDAYYNYGNLLFIHKQRSSEDIRQAQKFYLKAISIDSTYVKAYLNLAVLVAYCLDEIEEGIAYLKTAISIDSENDQLANNLASIYKDKKREFEEANKWYKRALHLNSKNALAHLNYAQLLGYNFGEIPKAIEHYLTATSLDKTVVNEQMEKDFGIRT